MLLRLITFDLRIGDIVIAKGNYRDKTVAMIEHVSDKDSLVTWSCGSKTRYNQLTEHQVWRGENHD